MANLHASRVGRRARHLGLALLFCATFGLIEPAWSQTREVKQTFPRLAGIQIGSNPYPGSHNDPDYIRDIARLDVAILSQNASDDTAVRIKEINPRILLGRYTNIISVGQNWCCDHETWRNKIGEERGPDPNGGHPDWWVRSPDTGERVERWPGTWLVNFTDYAKPDSNGDTWVDYRVKYDHERWFRNDVWDIWYSDSVHIQPRYRRVRGSYTGGTGDSMDEIRA